MKKGGNSARISGLPHPYRWALWGGQENESWMLFVKFFNKGLSLLRLYQTNPLNKKSRKKKKNSTIWGDFDYNYRLKVFFKKWIRL